MSDPGLSDTAIHHLGAAYALDALDDNERAAYEAHYVTCDICRTDVVEFRAAASELGALTAATPRPELKNRVMAEIATTRQLSPLPNGAHNVTSIAGRRRRIATVVLTAAAVAVLFVAGTAVFRGALSGGGESFGDQLEAMATEPTFGMTKLDGEGAGSFAVAWTDDQAAVMGDGLPDPGPDKRYELWMIDDSGSHAMYMLDPAENGEVRRMIDVTGAPTGWGITIESEQGSPVPTLPVLFLASMESPDATT